MRVDLNIAPSHAHYLRKKWFDELLIAQYGSVKKVIARPRTSRNLRREETVIAWGLLRTLATALSIAKNDTLS